MLSISGVGSVFGALAVAVLGYKQRKGLLTLGGLIFLGICIAGFAVSRNLTLSCILLFLGGGALIAVFSMVTSLVQLITTDEMRGRVMSVYNVAFRGGMPFGSLATGVLVPIFTAPAVLGVSGVLLTILGLYFLFVQRKITSL